MYSNKVKLLGVFGMMRPKGCRFAYSESLRETHLSNIKTKKKILMMPDYRHDNPYQLLLAKELQLQSFDVTFSQGYRRVFPLFRAVRDNHTTVLHLHWLTPYLKGENWFVRLIYSLKLLIDIYLLKLWGIKIVWTIHNSLSHQCQFPNIELWLRRSLVKAVDEIIIHNHSTVDNLEQFKNLNHKKLNIIPHGHYRQIYQPAIDKIKARKQLNLPSNGYLYLNLGTIRPYKGIKKLLQIWQSNQELLQEHTLLIAGKPLDKAYGAKISNLTVKTNKAIFRANFIPAEKMHLYFSAADIVVLPFTSILTSGSLILAMSYGKPIIAPCQGGIKETLQEADRLLYDSGDRNGLLKALEASTQVNLKELSHKVSLASDRLNWDKIAQATAKLYQ